MAEMRAEQQGSVPGSRGQRLAPISVAGTDNMTVSNRVLFHVFPPYLCKGIAHTCSVGDLIAGGFA